MRNGHASVTHNVTRESQPPVPSRPYPARPALYIERGETSTSIVASVPATLPRLLDGATLTQAASAIARFVDKVNFQPGDHCWEWMGEVNHRGYGRFRFREGSTVAHRFAYELTTGPVPNGLQVGHLCHNTRCVRPTHLEAMTCAKNIAQRDERLGRTPGSPLSSAERARRGRERARIKRAQERIESGWWVSI